MWKEVRVDIGYQKIKQEHKWGRWEKRADNE